MRTIGKIAALAMTLALAGALSACGSSASSSAAASSASASSAAASSAAASNAAASESASAASESASAASAESEALDLYNNEYFGISFELPEGWSFAEASALSNVNSQIGTFGNSEIDMAAISGEGSSVAVVSIEQPGDGSTAEAHAEAVIDHMLESTTGTNSYESNSATVNFGSREIPAWVTKFTAGESTVWVGTATAEKEGNFFDITIIGASEEEIMNVFSAFKGTVE